MIEYLKEFDTESKCKVLVVDPERRKRYDVEAAVVTDADIPVLCLNRSMYAIGRCGMRIGIRNLNGCIISRTAAAGTKRKR